MSRTGARRRSSPSIWLARARSPPTFRRRHCWRRQTSWRHAAGCARCAASIPAALRRVEVIVRGGAPDWPAELALPMLRIAPVQPHISDRRGQKRGRRHGLGVRRLIDIRETDAIVDQRSERLFMRSNWRAASRPPAETHERRGAARSGTCGSLRCSERSRGTASARSPACARDGTATGLL